VDEIGSKTAQGLSEREAAERLKSEGYNELPSADHRNFLHSLLDVFREPMFLLLTASAAIYLLLGDLQEALFLLGSFLMILGITLFQERRTERALEALRDLSSPRALVIREGKRVRIAGREVVRGDILVLSEGDRVSADAALLSCHDLAVNESLLTGEPVPVRKIPWDGSQPVERPGGENLPFVFSGTMVVQGQGIAEVRATGIRTEIGKIGRALQTIQPEETSLHREIGKLVRVFAVSGMSLCVLVTLLYGFLRDGWLNAVLAGVTLAMSLVPEEFPVVLTVFLALGAWRISQKRVLTRRIPAIETLGASTVLCVDKTGTLTLNQMGVSQLEAGGEFFTIRNDSGEPLPERFHEIVEYSILASETDPFDPMERAFQDLGRQFLSGTERLHEDWTLVQEYALSPPLFAMSHVWRAPGSERYMVAAKGAPESIADLCRWNDSKRKDLQTHIERMAADGLRVLAVARAQYSGPEWPQSQREFEFEYLGLVALADPVRPAVPGSLQECYEAGIRVVMITGDYPATARAIAKQIGLSNSELVVTGPELERMSEDELRDRVRTTNLFARVLPEQKLRLVNALKANGEIVAMTGDGVNDAPALKAAHIGIAMGARGTDVAREAASLILLDDDFTSIVRAIRQGRRIYDNLRKAMAYIFAIHVPIAGVALAPLLMRWPLVFFPVHILFLELIIDPACSIAFEAEPEEADIMNRPPRNPKEPLFTARTIGLCVLQGASVLAIVLSVYAFALWRGQGEADSRALTFTTLVIANLSLIFTNRSWSLPFSSTFLLPNRALWFVVTAALGFLALVLYVPFLRDLFRFSILHPVDLAICFSSGIASILWFELLKIFRRHP